MENIVDFLWETGLRLINLGNTLKDFLFTQFNVAGYTVSMWALLGGVGIVAIIIFKIAFR